MTLKIAVPNKGSLSESSALMLKEAGYRQRNDLRDLVFIDPDNNVDPYALVPAAATSSTFRQRLTDVTSYG